MKGKIAFFPDMNYSHKEIFKKSKEIYDFILKKYKNISEGNFTIISRLDLKLLFEQYDEKFFSGYLREILRRRDDSQLIFRLSSRMTKSGGITYIIKKDNKITYKISISSYLLIPNMKK